MMNKVRTQALDRMRSRKLFIPDLEALPLSDPTGIRDTKELVVRCVIHTEFKALTIYPESFKETAAWMQESNVIKYCSPTEQRVLQGTKLSAQDEIRYSWYSESLYALLLVLGIVAEHFSPKEEADIEKYARLIPPNGSLERFNARVKRISDLDTYILRDEYYLLHWLCRHGAPDLNTSVVLERRKAFEWICDASLDWDDVPLDT